jgi:methylthioribose-1-phosphate isomerase
MPPLSVEWLGNSTGCVRLLDQTRLPGEINYLDCRDVETVWEAIRSLRVRGAPAIGVAAAMGVVVGMQTHRSATAHEFAKRLAEVIAYFKTSRPTAVNLFWALDRVAGVVSADQSPAESIETLLAESQRIREEDAAMCRAMGRIGANLINDGDGILTHCNTGGLATAEYGTALAVIFTAHEQGKRIHVFADETRPLLQGARLTMWELQQHGVPSTLICDSMAAQVMKERRIQKIFVGADRIAANGDAANKIGTYGVAVVAKHHGIPFYVVAPSSTFDLSLPDGSKIPIEERDPREITEAFGKRTAPIDVNVYNPAFDVTPAELISGIITERGLISPVTRDRVRALASRASSATG